MVGSINIIYLYDRYHVDRKELYSFVFSVHIITAIFNVTCLLISGILIFKISRRLSNSEINKFEEEKQWYWSFLILLLIMLIIWSTEIVLWKENDISCSMISDLIKILSSFNIFVIFLFKESVKTILYDRFGSI